MPAYTTAALPDTTPSLPAWCLLLLVLSACLLINCGGGKEMKINKQSRWDKLDYSDNPQPQPLGTRARGDNDEMYSPQFGFCSPKDMVLFSCQ